MLPVPLELRVHTSQRLCSSPVPKCPDPRSDVVDADRPPQKRDRSKVGGGGGGGTGEQVRPSPWKPSLQAQVTVFEVEPAPQWLDKVAWGLQVVHAEQVRPSP